MVKCGFGGCSRKGTMKCSRCFSILYCSQACGTAHWTPGGLDTGHLEGCLKAISDRCMAILFCSSECCKENFKHHKKGCTKPLRPDAPAEEKAFAKKFNDKMVKEGLDGVDLFGDKKFLLFEFAERFRNHDIMGLKEEKPKSEEEDKKTKEQGPSSLNSAKWCQWCSSKVEATLEIPNFEQWLRETKEGDHKDSEMFPVRLYNFFENEEVPRHMDTHYLLRVVPHVKLVGGKLAIAVCNLCSNDTVLDHVVLTMGEETEHMYDMEKTTITFKSHAECRAQLKEGTLKFKVEVETYGEEHEEDEEKEKDEVKKEKEQEKNKVEEEKAKVCGLSSCSAKGTLKCSRCLSILYCSNACGKANWKHHKKDCKKAEDNK